MTIHRSATGVAVSLALGAGASSASARPFDLDAGGSFVPAGAAAQDATAAIRETRLADTPGTVVRVIAAGDGFYLADAGIGAGGGIVLTSEQIDRSRPRPPSTTARPSPSRGTCRAWPKCGRG